MRSPLFRKFDINILDISLYKLIIFLFPDTLPSLTKFDHTSFTSVRLGLKKNEIAAICTHRNGSEKLSLKGTTYSTLVTSTLKCCNVITVKDKIYNHQQFFFCCLCMVLFYMFYMYSLCFILLHSKYGSDTVLCVLHVIAAVSVMLTAIN